MQGPRRGQGKPARSPGRLSATGGVSVVVPAYNVEDFVGEALASIQVQTRPVTEILVVDDGSTDRTAARLAVVAAKDGRIRLLGCDHRGPSAARNIALAAATQPVIAFLDGDDVWPREKIAQQMQRLAAKDRPDVVSGHIRRFLRLDPATLMPAPSRFADMAHVNLGACLFRREVFEAIGPFDERLNFCEDVDLMFRVRERGLKLAIMREITLYYRIRPGSLIQTREGQVQQKRAAMAALRLTIGRRRRGGNQAGALPAFTSLIDK